MNSKLLSIVGALSITAFSAAQACEINARVSVVGNEFPAIQTVGAGAAACTGAEVSTNLTADHQKNQCAWDAGQPSRIYFSDCCKFINCRFNERRRYSSFG